MLTGRHFDQRFEDEALKWIVTFVSMRGMRERRIEAFLEDLWRLDQTTVFAKYIELGSPFIEIEDDDSTV
jgi:hypothetical protein